LGAPETASPLKEHPSTEDVVVDLRVAEAPVDRAEVPIEVVGGARVGEANLQQQPTRIAEEPLVETVGVDREEWWVDRRCLAVAAVLAPST
jgi:hypothetical protein